MTAEITSSGAGREWVSFVAGDGDTWLFDLTYFRSNWMCIYGAGCAGIEPEPDPAGHRGCCSYGAHFVDEDDLTRVIETARSLPLSIWQSGGLYPEVADPATPLEDVVSALTTIDSDGDRVTRVVEGACIFLNGPDADTGPGCALHYAAVANDINPLEWKPEVCWQLPIRVEHHVDDHDRHTHFVRQWTRGDWGAGDDLGWWCSDAPEAYVGQDSVAVYLREEVAALAGEHVADALIEHIAGVGTVVGLPRPKPRRSADSAGS